MTSDSDEILNQILINNMTQIHESLSNNYYVDAVHAVYVCINALTKNSIYQNCKLYADRKNRILPFYHITVHLK